MLEVQKYLQNNSIEELNKEFGTIVCKHESLPLMILNYDQLAGNKTHPINKECRALVLNSEDYSLVSRSFFRFFNWGETVTEQINFNWDNFIATSKEDGSLCNIFNWEGKWFANTRGSFGNGVINSWNKTWNEGFCEAMGIKSLEELDRWLIPDFSYSCEFVSPYNKVVRTYAKPAMYFLSAFYKEMELSYFGKYMRNPLFIQPEVFEFRSIDEILTFLKEKEVSDSTFEGVVVCDNKFNRWKLKSNSYWDLHRLKNNGNIAHPKNFLSFILNNTDDDLVAKLPELEEVVSKWRTIIRMNRSDILQTWYKVKDIENQKEFALAVKDNIYASVFFNAKKMKRDPIEVYNESPELILKNNKV